MPRRRSILVIVGVVALVGLVAVLVWPTREPEYLGKPIGYWMEPWQHHNTEPAERVNAAMAEMDDRAVRWLVAQLEWKPSSFVRSVNSVTRKASIVIADKPDRRERAAMLLGSLGAKAKAAIPHLERLKATASEPRASACRHAAEAALILVRGEPVAAALDRLLQGSDPARFETASLTLAYLGMQARDAVPQLISLLDPTNRPSVRANAAMALGAIRQSSSESVPALALVLSAPEPNLVEQALASLAVFGTNASAASPAVVKLLSGPNQWVAARASNVLAVIDPEAAKRYGIRKQEP